MRLSIMIAPLLAALRPADTRDLSASGRVYMLDLTFARHRFGISTMPFVAVPLVWLLSREQDATWLTLWAAFFLLFALSMQVVKRRFAEDLHTLDAEPMLQRWQPWIEHIALLHGAGLSAAVVLTADSASYEFELLLFASIASITASNATHQNASLSVFLRFFLTGWVTCTVLSMWAFPNHWPYMLPLCLLFGIAAYLDGLVAHQFFVDQVLLEDHGQLLIAQLQAALHSV